MCQNNLIFCSIILLQHIFDMCLHLRHIIIIIIIILVITFMQGIYNYIPEIDHVSGVYRVSQEECEILRESVPYVEL